MPQIVDGVYRVGGVNANCYVVEREGLLTVVDAGMGAGASRKVLSCVADEVGKKPTDVRALVITHAHIDHVGGAAALSEATGAEVWIHADDADFLSGKRRLPPPKGAVGVLFRLFSPFLRARPVRADSVLRDGDQVNGLKVIHIPGHTPGSIALFDRERSVMFVGDTLSYSRGGLRPGPKAFSLDYGAMMSSISKICEHEFNVLLCGHGDPLVGHASDLVRSEVGKWGFTAAASQK